MKTCIITGAGGGIGRAAAIQVSRTEMFESIVLIGRTLERLEITRNDMSNSDSVVLVKRDLCELDAIPAVVESIYRQTREINCLLNIAGYADPQPLFTTTINNFCLTYQTNVFAPFLMIRECAKYMRHNTEMSKILNVASTAGVTPRPGWLSYASSKAALIAMSETLSEELAEYGIRVYCISPGRCATELRRKLAPDEDQAKIMQPEEVGHIICELITDDKGCLDGQNIIIRKKQW